MSHFGKQFGPHLPRDPAIPRLDMYLQEREVQVPAEADTRVPHTGSSPDGITVRAGKVRHRHRMEYRSVMKRKALLIHTVVQIKSQRC